MSTKKTNKNAWETEDIKTRYQQGNIKIEIDSITPRAGPLYGTTRVAVRADQVDQLVDAFPNPKCRFGTNDMIVDATYVKCSKMPSSFYDKDKGSDFR